MRAWSDHGCVPDACDCIDVSFFVFVVVFVIVSLSVWLGYDVFCPVGWGRALSPMNGIYLFRLAKSSETWKEQSRKNGESLRTPAG